MGFTKVSGRRHYIKYKDCTPGQQLVKEGTYMGTEEGQYGMQHIFKLPDDDYMILNKAEHLNRLIDKFLKEGQRANVFYREKSKVTSGKYAGGDVHLFDLEVENKKVDAPTAVAQAEILKADATLAI